MSAAKTTNNNENLTMSDWLTFSKGLIKYIIVYLISFIFNTISLPINESIQINSGTSTTISNTNNLAGGTYVVTYKAIDSSGNISLITRTVIYS